VIIADKESLSLHIGIDEINQELEVPAEVYFYEIASEDGQ
jgi:hypothetical protein